LATLLENDLGAAEAVLGELRAGVAGSDLAQAVGEIGARVDEFAIDDALAMITALNEHLTEET
jgi:hypothetical protein